MKKFEQSRLQLTETQLLSIEDRIKNWSTKDKIIDIMRYKYCQIKDHAA